MNKKAIAMEKDEIDLLDYASVLMQHRQMIIRNVVMTAIAVIVISLLLPQSYTAITTILPPDQNQSANILSALSNTPLSSLIYSESATTSDLYVEILKSRSVLDGVLGQQFDYPKGLKLQQRKSLLKILKAKSLEKGRKKLFARVDIKASPEGIITIAVELKDRHLAADVANALTNELDKINKEKNTSRAKNSRFYIENQLNLTEGKLKKASEDLVAFQEKYKAIALEEQTKAAIEKAGELKGRIVAKEVELGVALQTMKADNIQVVQLKREINELRKQYNLIQYGDNLERGAQQEFYIPFAEVPTIGLELAKLTREVRVQETVWELLNQQYFHAKIQEARDTPTIQVLDEAVPPELRTKPKRKLLVLMGSFLALVFSICWAFLVEYLDRLKNDANAYQKTQKISDDLKHDWHKFKQHFIRFKHNRRNDS